MVDLARLHSVVDTAELLIEDSGLGDAGTRAERAAHRLRGVLLKAATAFLERDGSHPPPDLKVMGNVQDLIEAEFTYGGDLAREVVKALGRTSDPMHYREGLAPLHEIVRGWISVARRFLDALEPLLST